MRSVQFKLISLFFLLSTSGQAHALCDGSDSWLDSACQRVEDTWEQGRSELYIPFHSHHLRSAYTKEKIDSFREDTWGLGYGRSRYDDAGNLDSLYGMSFLDSHSKLQYIVGYSHQWIFGKPQGLHAGLGYTAFLTARSDIYHYIPIPGILPVASVNYDNLSINAAYVPGGNGNGNVVFIWSKFGL